VPLAEVGFAEASWIMVVKSILIFLGVFLIVPVLTWVERKLMAPTGSARSGCCSRSPTSSSWPASSTSGPMRQCRSSTRSPPSW
jgi:hypothetical protein